MNEQQDSRFGKYKYEKGKIYKLCCKDTSVTEIYIGSTLNQYRRKCEHKRKCENKRKCNDPNNKIYNFPVYQFIRDNGGFDNWDLIILEEYPAKNKNDLLWKEREWIEKLKPTLNSQRPIITTEELRGLKRENQKNYYENNKEKVRESDKKYRKNNPEKIRQIAKKYYQENKEKIKERVKCDICDKDLSRASLTRHKKTFHNNKK